MPPTKVAITGIAAMVAVLIELVVLAWGVNKGLDLSDEGWYLMLLAYPGEAPPMLEYGVFVGHLVGWADPGIVGYRVVRLVLTTLSGLVFGHAFWRWTRQNPR